MRNTSPEQAMVKVRTRARVACDLNCCGVITCVSAPLNLGRDYFTSMGSVRSRATTATGGLRMRHWHCPFHVADSHCFLPSYLLPSGKAPCSDRVPPP